MTTPTCQKARDGTNKNATPDEDHLQEMVDEVSALSLIYPDEFFIISKKVTNTEVDDNDRHDEDAVYEHPISYKVRLNPSKQGGGGEDEEAWPLKLDVYLKVEYPPLYPDVAPLLSLEHQHQHNNDSCDQNDEEKDQLLDTLLKSCLDSIENAATAEIGMPCIMTCIQTGRDFLLQNNNDVDDGLVAALLSSILSSTKTQQQQQQQTQRPDEKIEEKYDLLDNLPRPLLILVLEYTNIYDKTRLCIASKPIRHILEKRAKRALTTAIITNDIDDHSSDFPLSWDLKCIVTIEGEHIQTWKREEERVAEELRSYQEQLHAKQHTIEFEFLTFDHTAKEQMTKMEGKKKEGWKWRVCEGLEQHVYDEPSMHLVDHDLNYDWNSGGGGVSWLFNTTINSFMVHYICATKVIPPSNSSSSKQDRYYNIRVRMKSIRDYGDLSIGLVTNDFNENPSQYLDTVPGAGFGIANQYCAFINLIGGTHSSLVEADLGLVINANTGCIKYGIPIGSYHGRGIFNNGEFESSIMDFNEDTRSNSTFDDDGNNVDCNNNPSPIQQQPPRPIYVAVLAVRKVDQQHNFFQASVSMQEVSSERKWQTKMVFPYNSL